MYRTYDDDVFYLSPPHIPSPFTVSPSPLIAFRAPYLFFLFRTLMLSFALFSFLRVFVCVGWCLCVCL